jgi:hypothetical protein
MRPGVISEPENASLQQVMRVVGAPRGIGFTAQAGRAPEGVVSELDVVLATSAGPP